MRKLQNGNHTMGKMSFKFVDEPWSTNMKGFQGCIFTNGCFDIIHRGHIELFKFCRSQHAYKQVVVGVNSDKSIRELKGPDRPIMLEKDRVAVLLAIQWIDYVVIFDSKSVLPVIKAAKPSFLIKGGNYSTKACASADQIVGQEFVESYDGRVYTAPMVEGISTTEIVKKINENAHTH
jgi:D-beta-D-heptose 7-phosphate kinase / D-beta-D-heptose 1-phosphate adenosyltransferase